MTKTTPGNFFEDFRLGQTIRHATPRTVTPGDVALYNALFGARFAPQSSDAFAYAIGYPRVAGRRSAGVPHRVRQDRAGYLAQCGCQPRLRGLPLPARGLSGRHAHRGLRSDRAEGELEPQDRRGLRALVRLQAGRRQGARLRALGDGAQARRGGAPRPAIWCRELPKVGRAGRARRSLPEIVTRHYDFALAGSPHRFGDYQVGEKIDHVDGMTVEEAEHQMATRLYQNTARVHFNQFAQSKDRFGRRLIYGGARDLAGACALVQRARECVPHHGDQWRAGTSRRCSRAARCSRGPRCWPKPNCRGAPMSARCACARSRRRISPARIFRSSRMAADHPAVHPRSGLLGA